MDYFILRTLDRQVEYLQQSITYFANYTLWYIHLRVNKSTKRLTLGIIKSREVYKNLNFFRLL